MAEFDKIGQVKGLGEKADTELEDIADRALQSYEDLMDLRYERRKPLFRQSV